jgi:hypothetical protein
LILVLPASSRFASILNFWRPSLSALGETKKRRHPSFGKRSGSISTSLEHKGVRLRECSALLPEANEVWLARSHVSARRRDCYAM